MGMSGFRKIAAIGLLLGMTTVFSGCYGQFALVKTIYKANGSVENKWARSTVTALLVILPVYGLAGLGDVIIFNPIEFWSHVNPISNKPSVSSSRTQGPGADPTKTPDGWLSRKTTSGKSVLLAWHYDPATKRVSAIGISRGFGKPSVTLYRSEPDRLGVLGAGVRTRKVTFLHGRPSVTVSEGAGAL